MITDWLNPNISPWKLYYCRSLWNWWRNAICNPKVIPPLTGGSKMNGNPVIASVGMLSLWSLKKFQSFHRERKLEKMRKLDRIWILLTFYFMVTRIISCINVKAKLSGRNGTSSDSWAQLTVQILWGLLCVCVCFNTLRPRQDGRHFPDDIFKCIFLNWNV